MKNQPGKYLQKEEKGLTEAKKVLSKLSSFAYRMLAEIKEFW